MELQINKPDKLQLFLTYKPGFLVTNAGRSLLQRLAQIQHPFALLENLTKKKKSMYLLEKFTFRGKNVGPKYSNEKQMSAFSFIEFVQINK